MNFADIFWSMIVFFFWFMLIWIWVQVFADLFRRRDLSGWWKVIWMLVIFFLPLLGPLVYMLMRKPTEQDREDMAQMQEMQRRVSGYSAADEIAKLEQLKSSGALTQEEFDRAKARALG